MSNFSIHLSEPLSDAEAKRVAQVIAPALRGNPEKLHLLLSKQPGSRIARASSQRQAETVAGILRNAGVKVEVLETVGDVAPPQNSLAPSPDPFAAPSIPPLASLAPSADVFASEPPKSTRESYKEPEPPVSDPFASFRTPDPFAAAPVQAPDPFAALANEPFAAPKADPFAAPKADPFAAPVLRNRPAPEATLSPDPFAAPDTAVVMDTKATQTDLPAQARRARDRVLPRGSIQRQLFQTLMIPIILVALGVVGYMFYELPILYREELGRRAYQAARGEAEANSGFFKKLPDPAVIRDLQTEADEDLGQIPEAVAIIYGSDVMEISGTNGHVAAVASVPSVAMTPSEARAIDEQFHKAEESEEKFTLITLRGKQYVGAVAEVEEEENEKDENEQPATTNAPEIELGEVQVLFSLEDIPTRVISSLIPLFVTLGIILLVAIFIANALSSRLARPIIAATEQANRIALGDLDRSVSIESNDEIGDMLNSLERMRVSLKSMVARMRRNT